jgi:hypothetical protein
MIFSIEKNEKILLLLPPFRKKSPIGVFCIYSNSILGKGNIIPIFNEEI